MFAAFVQGPLIRIIPVGMVLLALQRTILVEMQVGDVIIELMMATAAAAGVAGGSERGALVGFVFGVMYDLVEGTPLGSITLAMTVAGIVGGLLALVAADPHWWLGAAFTALGTAAGVATIPVVRAFIGESADVGDRLVTVLPVVAIAAAVMSPVLVPLARWCLKLRRPEWTQPVDDATA